MNKEKLLSPLKVAQILGVSTKTVRRWDESKKIKVIRTPSNQRRIPESEVKRLLGLQNTNSLRYAIYARVSSKKQSKEGNLERQKERLEKFVLERGANLIKTIEEEASSLNENRKGLKKLFESAKKGEIDVVLVEFKDRLARFGFSYIEEVFHAYGVKVEVLEQKEDKGVTKELVEDMLAIIAEKG